MLFKKILKFIVQYTQRQALQFGSKTSSSQAVGYKGEALAVQYLKGKGFKIISRNWHHSSGEIDIIASDGPILVFVEVKARTQSSGNAAYYAVNAKKKDRLRKACAHYLRTLSSKPKHYRFDVIEIGLIPNKPYTVQHHIHVPLFSKYFFVPA